MLVVSGKSNPLKKYERGFLFSKLSITKAAKELKDEAAKIIPWNLIRSKIRVSKLSTLIKRKCWWRQLSHMD